MILINISHQNCNRVLCDALMQLQHGLLQGAHIGSVLMQILRELNTEIRSVKSRYRSSN